MILITDMVMIIADQSGNHNGTGFSENIPSFIEITYGCTDEFAINYNEEVSL